MPRNTLNIECLMQAIDEYSDAKTDRDRARDGYEGYSWGYHGRHFEDAVAHKAAKLEDRLLEVVRTIVQDELKHTSKSGVQANE